MFYKNARIFCSDFRFHLGAFEVKDGRFGAILRAKGIVAGEDGQWIHFDYVPEEINVREGGADIIGRLCVIGANIHGDDLAVLFGVN